MDTRSMTMASSRGGREIDTIGRQGCAGRGRDHSEAKITSSGTNGNDASCTVGLKNDAAMGWKYAVRVQAP